MRRLFLLGLLLSLAAPAFAQQPERPRGLPPADADFAEAEEEGAASGGGSFLSQHWLVDIIERRTDDLDALPPVFYDYYIVRQSSRLEAKLALNQRFGRENRPLIHLLNRNNLENLRPGDTLVVPTKMGVDFRAYSPFPRFYPGGRTIPKLVVLDKSVQAFGAYEFGRLVRWGVMNTGKESSRTPSGRYNINWKQEYRVSTLSPPDELWEMYWVMNIHEERGIHLHQYALPTGGPASHGCVRLLEPDARWMYFWSDGWDKVGGTDISSVGASIRKQGTIVLVIGQDINADPQPFVMRPGAPELRMVSLPTDPYLVPPGTSQQQRFDRQRTARPAPARPTR